LKFRFNILHILSAVSMIALILLCSEARAEEVSEIKITGLTTISEAVVRDVIPIKPGDTFSFKQVEDSLSYLRKWGIFDMIEASPTMTPDGVVITFHLEEAIIVESIDIDGNYPYIENKIRKYLSLHAGDIYTPERLEDQIHRIEAFYKRQGFVGTKAYAGVQSLPETNGVAITIKIKRGQVLRYRNIEISGNRAYPDGRFVSKINPLLRFSERKLKDAIHDLRDFYRKHGYPRAKIKLTEKIIDFESRRVDIKLEVYEGPYVKLKFTGSPHTSRRLLRKTITILEDGSIDELEIDVSSQELRKLFISRGYPDARVEGSKKLLPDGNILITFNIDKGRPSRIHLVDIRGNEGVSSSKIIKKMRNRSMSFKRSGAYFPDLKESDNEAIQREMQRGGYLDAQVGKWTVKTTRQGYALDITVPIDTGRRILVERVVFNTDKSFRKKKLLKAIKLKENKPFDEPGLEIKRERLVSFLADNGYPYAKVKYAWELNEETGNAIITFSMDEGKLVHIGRILMVGDVLTSQKALNRAMTIKAGDVFSYRKIIESQLNIRRLGPFSSVNVTTIGLEDERSVVNIKVKVEERRPFYIDVGFNYSTDQHLTGSMRFTNLNSFGWAKTNTLQLTGGRYLTRAEIGWRDPRFLASNLEMTANGWIQYKDKPTYSFIQLAGGLGWFRRLKRFGFLFRWELDRNYFITGDSVAADADSLRNNTISQITISTSFDSRDSFSDPRRGFFTMGSVGIFNEIKGNNADFFNFTWDGENNLSPFRWITLSTALRFSRIQTIGKNVSVPTNELLFLGGDDTIRGYSEDSLGPVNAAGRATGGRTRWIWNEELRIRLFWHLQLAGFLDVGCLFDNFSAATWYNTRKGAGLGLRYITPVGPIRLDYGFKLDRRVGESMGRLHLTFGYVF